MSVGYTILLDIVVLALSALLIWKISQGRNWARVTFLILFITGFIIAAVSLPLTIRSGQLNLADEISVAVQILIQIYAAFLLAANPGKSWFSPPKPP